MLSKVFACIEIPFWWQLPDFILIIFIHLSAVSYETGNVIKLFLGPGVGSLCHPPFPNLLFLLLGLYDQFGREYQGIS